MHNYTFMRDKSRIFTLFLANVLHMLTLFLAVHDDAVKHRFEELKDISVICAKNITYKL